MCNLHYCCKPNTYNLIMETFMLQSHDTTDLMCNDGSLGVIFLTSSSLTYCFLVLSRISVVSVRAFLNMLLHKYI